MAHVYTLYCHWVIKDRDYSYHYIILLQQILYIEGGARDWVVGTKPLISIISLVPRPHSIRGKQMVLEAIQIKLNQYGCHYIHADM